MTTELVPTTPTAVTPFEIENVRLAEVCWLNGSPFFTARAIEEWMGYRSTKRGNSVLRLVDKNPAVLPFSVLTAVVSTDGKKYVTRVFNVFGLNLLVSASNLPNKAVLAIQTTALLAASAAGQLKPPVAKLVDRYSCKPLFDAILSSPHKSGNADIMKEAAARLGISWKTSYGRMQRYSQTGSLGTRHHERAKRQKDKAAAGYVPIIDYIKAGHTKQEAVEHFKTSHPRVLRALKEIAPNLQVPRRKRTMAELALARAAVREAA